jgi:hypothetical protein
MNKLISILDNLNYEELWLLKGLCEKRLVSFNNGTNNFVGDRAVDLAENIYNTTPGLEKVQKPYWPNTKEYDLYSARSLYSVKGLKGKNRVTSPFCGYTGNENHVKLFDYVILVRMDELYQLEEILEISWDTFQKHAKLNNRDKNYKLNLTNKLRDDSNIIFSKGM